MLFVADADIWLLERRNLVRLTPDRLRRQPSWSRDGRRIAHTRIWTSGSDLWLMDADGSNSAELTRFTRAVDSQQRHAWWPTWLPDGERLLYLSDEGSFDPQLWQLTLSTGQRRRLLTTGERYGGLNAPRLSPDGRTLALTSFQPGRGPEGRSQIWLYALAGGTLLQVTEAPDGAYDAAWSPDGRRLAFTVRRGARHDIWVSGGDGSGAQQVTASGRCRAPAWSPDGSWIAYLSAQAGLFDIWAVPAPSSVAGTEALSPTTPERQVTRNGVLDATSGLSWAA
jgi:TolB protein